MTTEHGTEGLVSVEVDDAAQVAVVTLDRPPVNAVNQAMQLAITKAFQGLGERRDVNAIVLTAAGRVFCAGADLRERSADSDERPLDPGRAWREAKSSLLNCALPVIGAVNGAAIGAGVGLCAACDILIASENAQFGVTEINVGLLGGGTAAMRLVGRPKMRRMYFTGEMVSAQEVHRLGGVESVVPPDQLMPEALDLARTIAAKSPIALRLAKESLNRFEEFVLPYEAAYRMEQDYTNRLRTFEDAREGTLAFVEKRQPQWKWR
jgi:enoyl-CoA hydratase